MKKLLLGLFLFTCCGHIYGQAPHWDEKQAKSMMQGLWKLRKNDSVTIAISGDTLLEYRLGDKEPEIYDCKLSKQPCDNEDFIPSPTGLYFTIGDSDEEGFCAPLKSIDNRHFELLLDEKSVVIFEKMQ